MAATSSLCRGFVFIIFWVINGHASKLNVPKLLLPYYSQSATNFTLEASEGCFAWKSTRPEIVCVHPDGVDDPSACSRSAVITAVSRVPTRKTAIIMAENPVTGQTLRCDVIVDTITVVEIETTTKELFLDDSPEEFVLRATNDKDDVFSSLNGLTFDWNLAADTETGVQNVVSAHNVLRILKYSESSYTAPAYIKALEEQGKRGDRILMRGLHTGAAVITVKPSDPVYKQLPESRVRIMVVANLQLTPSSAYIMQHAKVTYTVELLKQGRVHVVSMPSQQYYIELDNTTVASFDTATSTAVGLEFGSTEVKLKGHGMQESGTFREPSAGLFVVTPGYLEFSIDPGRSWLIQTSHIYNIHIEVFDKESHKIFPSENIRIKADFSSEYFRVIFSSVNGSYHIVETVRKGFTSILGELKTVILDNGEEFALRPSVEGSQSVEIFDPVVLLPKVLVLPWDPAGSTVQYLMMASGGSGNYTWRSSNSTIVHVNRWGLVTTTGGMVGSTEVTVSDVRNPTLYDVSMVSVLPPSHVEFVESRVEAEVGTVLRLPIALYGRLDGKPVKFHDCHSISFNIVLSEKAVFRYVSIEKPTVNGSCADVLLEANVVGHVEVSVVYEHSLFRLRAAITVAAYRPLEVVSPPEIAVVTLGASKQVIFEGGPQPWVLDSSRYFRNASAENEKNVKLGSVSTYDASRNQHVFWVECLVLGEQLLNLTVGNEPTAKNKFPARSQSSVRFACEEPKTMQLMPFVEYPKNVPPCPISAEFDDLVPVPVLRHTLMVVTLTDRLGRKFDNFSSMAILWELSDVSRAELKYDVKVVDEQSLQQQLKSPYVHYMSVEMKGKRGHLMVSAEITGYEPAYTQNLPSVPVVLVPIKRSRTLDVVSYPSLPQDQISIFNHPLNKVSQNIDDGSGHFHLDRDPPSPYNANITYGAKREREIYIVPVREGTVTLSVIDICLPPAQPTLLTVIVSDIASIVVDVIEKVPLYQSVIARVKVFNHAGQPIARSHHALMDLRVLPASDIVSVRRLENATGVDEFTAIYNVNGLSLGRTNLVATASYPTKKGVCSSDPKDIYVFPPVVIDPKVVTIIVGAQFEVSASGGPEPESAYEFVVEDKAIGTINPSGVVVGNAIGKTVITVRAVDSQSRRTVYSTDTAILNVVELTGIKIVAPLTRLQTGTVMPMYAAGVLDDVTPFSFASVVPPLSLCWSVGNKQVAKLESSFYKGGLQIPNNGSLSVQFLANEAGIVTVKLKATLSLGITEQVYTDSITIQVFEKLQLTAPPLSDGVILVTPNTQTEIKTNRDGSSARVTFSVTDCDTIHRTDRPAPITVTSGGLLSTGPFTGQACLLVTAHEEFPVNQTAVVLVKIKALSYVMTRCETVVNVVPGAKVTTFPVAMSIHLSISYHDDVGVEFYATSSKIRYRVNKNELLQVQPGHKNNTLVFRTTGPGLTVLKIWEESNPSISDYVGIEVGSSIHPAVRLVAVGTLICFGSNLMSAEGHGGDWLSYGTALSIHRQLGIAQAIHGGSALVKYNVSAHSSTQTEVKVVPVTNISLKANVVDFITNVQPTRGRRLQLFEVTVENTALELKATMFGSNCSDVMLANAYRVERLPFKCRVSLNPPLPDLEVNDLLRVKPLFDPMLGRYFCSVDSTTSSENALAISSVSTSVELRAAVVEATSLTDLQSEPVVVPYMPAFVLLTRELHVSSLQSLVYLKVSASQDVLDHLHVISKDETVVTVKERLAMSSSEPNIVQYPVEFQMSMFVFRGSQIDVSVDVKCTKTGQVETVPVFVMHGENMDLNWIHLLYLLFVNYYNFFFLMLSIFATIVCCVIAYHMLQNQRYRSAPMSAGVYQPQSPNRSALQAPGYTTPGPVYSNGSPQNTRLWSVDRSPYANTSLRRSPHT